VLDLHMYFNRPLESDIRSLSQSGSFFENLEVLFKY